MENKGCIICDVELPKGRRMTCSKKCAREYGYNLDSNRRRKLREEKKFVPGPRKITKNSRGIQHYCIDCGKKISRGSERCISCGTKGRRVWNIGRKSIETSGEKSVHWKGGKIKHSDGYILIYSPNHPNKNKSGYVLEHRLVVEKYIGRFLTEKEVVHHIDENKQNNKIENLMLFNGHKDHGKFHVKIRQFGLTNPILRQIENRWKKHDEEG